MILVDNRDVLRTKDRSLLERMIQLENEHLTGNVIVEPSKQGVPTLKLLAEAKMQYILSKYDPIKDAERLVSNLTEMTAKHVLFIGVGLGYHIEAFVKIHPNTKFFIYEPNEEVLLAYLSHAKLNDLPLHNLLGIFTGTDSIMIKEKVQSYLGMSSQALQIVTLPTYKKLYTEQLTIITELVVNSLKGKRTFIQVESAFQKRWTGNSIKNFPVILETPNILHDIEKNVFEGKPAIIVAAGPSLNDEYENLRYIKENGLAYIFSVGSAVNALIEQGIYPDATCTYDPQGVNAKVIQVIKDKEIKSIPLVFGSTVGFETLENYPGDLLHVLISQDTIAPALLGNHLVTDLNYVNDAASVAIVTYQILSQLGCNKIILVGQNLAYVGQEHYASGINYGERIKVTESALASALNIKDVYGNEVKTTDFFNRMRNQLEMYIKSFPLVETINATKSGAAIEGTTFMPLEKIIKEHLTMRVVTDNWYDVKNTYDLKKVYENVLIIDKEQKALEKLLKQAMKILEKLNRRVEQRTLGNIEVQYVKFDDAIERVKKNLFYRSFIEPMIRVPNKQLAEKMSTVRYEQDPLKKGTIVIEAFYVFIHEISLHHQLATKLFEEMQEEINLTTEKNLEV